MESLKPKLIKDSAVEVRIAQSDLYGCWKVGKVVRIENRVRYIKLPQSDQPVKVDVSAVLDEKSLDTSMSPTFRGWLRPLPPKVQDQSFTYGVCVDAYIDHSWREGVIIDSGEGADEQRVVYFPDWAISKHQNMVSTHNLRITQDWNESTEEWSIRGEWFFLNLVKKEMEKCPLLVPIEEVWSNVWLSDTFQECITEWMCCWGSVPHVWSDLVSKSILKYLSLTAEHALDRPAKGSLGMIEQRKRQRTLFSVDAVNQPGAVAEYHRVDRPAKGSLGMIEQKKRKASADKWTLFSVDAVNHPGAVAEYHRVKEAKAEKAVTNKANDELRQHLAWLGWRIEISKPTENDHRQRFRYFRPRSDGKPFLSLQLVCEEIE